MVEGVLYNFVFTEFLFKTVSGDVTAFHRIQMKRKELTKTFMMISNRKTPPVSMVYTKIYQLVRVNMSMRHYILVDNNHPLVILGFTAVPPQTRDKGALGDDFRAAALDAVLLHSELLADGKVRGNSRCLC